MRDGVAAESDTPYLFVMIARYQELLQIPQDYERRYEIRPRTPSQILKNGRHLGGNSSHCLATVTDISASLQEEGCVHNRLGCFAIGKLRAECCLARRQRTGSLSRLRKKSR